MSTFRIKPTCNIDTLDNTKDGNLEKMKKDNSNLESDEDHEGYEKPYMSYAQLIAEAINNAPEQILVLSDIYKAINAKHPYYKLENHGWQNSIRQNLSLNKNFVKGKKDTSGQGLLYRWTEHSAKFFFERMSTEGGKKAHHLL